MTRYTPLRSFLHRHGIARLVNCTTGWGTSETVTALVETALPLKLLARYAARDPICRLHHARITEHEHLGLLRRRWRLRKERR